MEKSKVRIYLRPYSHERAKELVSNVTKEFGPRGQRWHWAVCYDEMEETNDWILDFWFKDHTDAMIFGLKYSL